MNLERFNEILYNYVIIGFAAVIFLFKASEMSAFEVVTVAILVSIWFNVNK